MEKHIVTRTAIVLLFIGSAALGINGWSEYQEANNKLTSIQELQADKVTIPIIEQATGQSKKGSSEIVGAIVLGYFGLRLKQRQ